ncbi:hypothetical protein AK812_SmicGene16746 [Symbiodinium microadriaticum]|uniref:Protein kinase domain-containing protein n=1 Tax=Symbiodinium microadriaticum TaxID=2951 RepID=A0A1Q9DZG3_SYMMI|nr:hypothetical protein AK812_SmicGene16746 [Symbiodinium microadriaticum]
MLRSSPGPRRCQGLAEAHPAGLDRSRCAAGSLSIESRLLSAVTHIHANGIIHLDVKSQNIMLMPALETKMRFVQAEPNEAVCSIDIFKEWLARTSDSLEYYYYSSAML